MKKNVDEAINDISIIKNYIEKSKNSNAKLYNMFLLFAITNICYFITTNLASIFISKEYIPAYITQLITLIIYIISFISFIRIKKSKTDDINKYNFIFFNVCAFIFLVLPILCIFLRLVLIKNNFDADIGSILVKIQTLSMLLNIILLCFCMTVISSIYRNKILLFVSLIVLIFFIILSTFYSNKYLMFSNINISIIGLYYYLILTLGYIYLAFISNYKENKLNECK